MKERDRSFSCILLIFTLSSVAPAAQKYEYEAKDDDIQPEKILDAIGVEPGMVVADAGTGRGYLAWKLARRVGPTGKVYANDIDQEGLSYIEDKCRKDGIDMEKHSTSSSLSHESSPRSQSLANTTSIVLASTHRKRGPTEPRPNSIYPLSQTIERTLLVLPLLHNPNLLSLPHRSSPP
jgi:hypothetical protein